MNVPRRTACFAKGMHNYTFYLNSTHFSILVGRPNQNTDWHDTDNNIKAVSCQTTQAQFRPWQYAILSLAGSQNLCQTMKNCILSGASPSFNTPILTSDVRIQASRILIRIQTPRIRIQVNPNPPLFSWIRIRMKQLWIQIWIRIQRARESPRRQQNLKLVGVWSEPEISNPDTNPNPSFFFLNPNPDSYFLALNPNPNPAQKTLNPDSNPNRTSLILTNEQVGHESLILFLKPTGLGVLKKYWILEFLSCRNLQFKSWSAW